MAQSRCYLPRAQAADLVLWPHSAFRWFTVKSLYSTLISGLNTTKFKDVWRACIPLKIKIFLWQAIRGKLPAVNRILKRNRLTSEFCALCAGREDSNHILFKCDLVVFLWSCTRSWLGVNWAPNSFAELLDLSRTLTGQMRRVFWFGFAAMCWVYGRLETRSLLNTC